MATRWKHHFIPECYLKRWAGADDGRLCEFSRRPHGICARMTHPGGTGYEWNLYTEPVFGADQQNVLEEQLFRVTDQQASDALDAFTATESADLSAELRSGWARFIRALQQRNPESVAHLRGAMQDELIRHLDELEPNYHAMRRESDPLDFGEVRKRLAASHAVERASASTLERIIHSEDVGSLIINMRWRLIDISNTGRKFLTSDRPVVVSHGIIHFDSLLALPIGPRTLFIAVNTPEAEESLLSNVSNTITYMNTMVVRQAQKFVYGRDRSLLNFVKRELR